MPSALHYAGDCRDYEPGQIFGPDLYGAYFNPSKAIYDEARDVTTIFFSPATFETAMKRSFELDPNQVNAPACLRPSRG